MRKKVLAGIAAGIVAALSVGIPANAATNSNAVLSVLHGIPDTPVDVYVNGALTLDDFQPGDLAGPLDLPAGDYEVALTATDAADDSSPVLGPVTLTLDAGKNYTAVAHLNESGSPTVTPYVNDTSKLSAGQARLTVRHDAAAPAVDVRAGGKPVFKSLANPDEAKADLPAGTVKADVVLAGTSTVAIGPADVSLEEGTNTIVYAWGSATDKNLKLAVQTISGLHGNPSGVPGGSGGQAAEQSGSDVPLWLIGVLGLTALGVVGSGTVAIRRRVRS